MFFKPGDKVIRIEAGAAYEVSYSNGDCIRLEGIDSNLDTNKINFHSHTSHNPSCDILEFHIDNDTFITYGTYVKPTIHYKGALEITVPIGTEFMEIYTGENYNVNSKKRSHSRMYYMEDIPEKYKVLWNTLRRYYKFTYNGNSTN